MGVEVPKSRMAEAAVQAAHSAGPSHRWSLNTKNIAHGMIAIALASTAAGQSDIGRCRVAMTPIITMVTSMVRTKGQLKPPGMRGCCRRAQARM